MTWVAKLGLVLVPVMASGACAVDAIGGQKEAHARRMVLPPATGSTTPAAAARPTDDPAALQPAPRSIAVPPGGPGTNAAPGTFEQEARPVLMRKCAPCHEPGGQMYGKLPFDNAGVVSSHPGGVLKRLQGDDRRTVADWLAKNPPPAPPAPAL
jgi:hypothetical protein